MGYLLFAAAVIFVTSLRTFSFGIWQLRNKNVLGGIAVMVLAIAPAVMIAGIMMR